MVANTVENKKDESNIKYLKLLTDFLLINGSNLKKEEQEYNKIKEKIAKVQFFKSMLKNNYELFSLMINLTNNAVFTKNKDGRTVEKQEILELLTTTVEFYEKATETEEKLIALQFTFTHLLSKNKLKTGNITKKHKNNTFSKLSLDGTYDLKIKMFMNFREDDIQTTCKFLQKLIMHQRKKEEILHKFELTFGGEEFSFNNIMLEYSNKTAKILRQYNDLSLRKIGFDGRIFLKPSNVGIFEKEFLKRIKAKKS